MAHESWAIVAEKNSTEKSDLLGTMVDPTDKTFHEDRELRRKTFQELSLIINSESDERLRAVGARCC